MGVHSTLAGNRVVSLVLRHGISLSQTSVELTSRSGTYQSAWSGRSRRNAPIFDAASWTGCSSIHLLEK